MTSPGTTTASGRGNSLATGGLLLLVARSASMAIWGRARVRRNFSVLVSP